MGGRRDDDVSIGELERRLNAHEDTADEHFKKVEKTLAEVKKLTEDHDRLLLQISGGLKVLRFLGWLVTGGLLLNIAIFFKRVAAFLHGS